jgi:hypothetical protein
LAGTTLTTPKAPPLNTPTAGELADLSSPVGSGPGGGSSWSSSG